MINKTLYINQINKSLNSILNKEKLFNKTILVTGASGLIGRGIVKALSALNAVNNSCIKIVACGRDEKKLAEIFNECNDKNIVTFVYDINKAIDAEIQIDYVIHCAAITQSSLFASSPKEVLFDNIIALKNLLDFSAKKQVSRFLFLSSQEVYGQPYNWQKRFREDDLGYLNLSDTRSIYPYTKRLGELMCAAYAKQDNLDYVCIRLGKVFGPDFANGDKRIGADFLQKAALGENLILNTKGNQKISFCYIIDAVTAILSVLTAGNSGETYNAAPCSAVTVYEFATLCAQAGNVKAEVKESKVDLGYSKVSHIVQNFDKIKALGYVPCYTVKSGLQSAISILRNKKELYDN